MALCVPLTAGPGLAAGGTAIQPLVCPRSAGNRVRRVDAGGGWSVHTPEHTSAGDSVEFVWNKAIYNAHKLAAAYGD